MKRAYYGLLLAASLLGHHFRAATIWRADRGLARTRYAVGQGAQQDVLRVQVELTRIEERGRAEGEAEIRLAELNRLLARPADSPLETSAKLTLRPLGRGWTNS